MTATRRTLVWCFRCLPRRVYGRIFPAASALIDRRVLNVNKLQYILAASDVSRLVERIEAAIDAERPALPRPDEYRRQWWKASRWDPPEVVYVKRLLQDALPESVRRPLVDELFRSLVSGDERAFADELYMAVDDARAMRAGGMTIGAHGDRHVRLPTLSRDEQAVEIDGALRVLDAVGSPRENFVYCYANGAYNEDSLELLRARGCSLAVTTRPDLAKVDCCRSARAAPHRHQRSAGPLGRGTERVDSARRSSRNAIIERHAVHGDWPRVSLHRNGVGADSRRPVAVGIVLLAIVVALSAKYADPGEIPGAGLRVPHASPFRSLPLPIAASDLEEGAGADPALRRGRHAARARPARVRRRHGDAARRTDASAGRHARGLVSVRARRQRIRRGARPRRSGGSERLQDQGPRRPADDESVRAAHVHVQEPFVRAGLPNLLRHQGPGGRKTDDAGGFSRDVPRCVRELRPKYAVPFASMVAFLHPESRHCNMYAVRPPEVAAAAAASDVAATTETVLMVPGDTWSADGGFALQPNDYYARQDQWIERLAAASDSKIQEEDDEERGKALTFDRFSAHFGGFLEALPPLIWLVLRRPMVFHVPSDAARRSGCSTSVDERSLVPGLPRPTMRRS